MVSLDNMVCYKGRKSFKQLDFQLQSKPCSAEPAWAAVGEGLLLASALESSTHQHLKHVEKRNYFPFLPPEVLVKLQSAKQQSAVKLQAKFTAISTTSEEETASERSDCPASCRGRCASLSALIGWEERKKSP